MLTDTHCHLHILKNHNKAIREAERLSVSSLISCGVDFASSRENIRLAKKHAQVFASVGLHPANSGSENTSLKFQLQSIEKLIEKERKNIVALGEVGLDFAPPRKGKKIKSKKEQISLFKKQIELAIKYHLPLIIHNRKASLELIEIIKEKRGKIRGVFHCFTGGKKLLEKILSLDFYIGIGGLVTYNQGLQEVVKIIPLNKLLLETDSPYLMPEPIRQKKRWPNEPKNVKIVAQKIAELKGDSFISIAQATSGNAKRLFNLNG